LAAIVLTPESLPVLRLTTVLRKYNSVVNQKFGSDLELTNRETESDCTLSTHGPSSLIAVATTSMLLIKSIPKIINGASKQTYKAHGR
jgi:hypothetical protein